AATTGAAAGAGAFGWGLTPLGAGALTSPDGSGPTPTTPRPSSPPASQPVSIAPPIFPAPASTMVPVMFFKAFVLLTALTTNQPSSRRRPGPITTGGFSGAS